MKLKATKKQIRDGYHRILSIGYCEADNLLGYESAFAYSAGQCGWACDYYDIDGVCISTGYNTLSDKNMKHDYKVVRAYNERSRALNSYGDTGKAERRGLLQAMIKELSI